jgi:Mce-associated membrane protein
VSKRTPTKDVFDRLDELDDRGPEAVTATAKSGADDEIADGTGEDNQTGARRPRRRVLALLVGAVVAAALGFSAFVGWQLKQLDDTAAAGRAALEAARNYAVTLTTLDSKNIDKNYQQALDGATGEFKDQYSQGATQLRQVLIDNNATGKGIVIDAAVKSATKTKAEVLLFVDQSITNAVNPSPRIDRNRIQMTMELVDNRWLASKVEIL